MDSGNMHHFVGADTSCISWGQALSGELGYGPDEQKSSANPKKVDILEDMHIISVACGFAHSMVVVDRTNVGDRLDQLDVYDDKASGKGSEEPASKISVAKKTNKKGAVKTSENSKKRKSKDSSELEDEEKDSDHNEEQVNGQAEQKMQRGGKAGRGRGNGASKPTPEKKSAQSARGKGKSAKRGRA